MLPSPSSRPRESRRDRSASASVAPGPGDCCSTRVPLSRSTPLAAHRACACGPPPRSTNPHCWCASTPPAPVGARRPAITSCSSSHAPRSRCLPPRRRLQRCASRASVRFRETPSPRLRQRSIPRTLPSGRPTCRPCAATTPHWPNSARKSRSRSAPSSPCRICMSSRKTLPPSPARGRAARSSGRHSGKDARHRRCRPRRKPIRRSLHRKDPLPQHDRPAKPAPKAEPTAPARAPLPAATRTGRGCLSPCGCRHRNWTSAAAATSTNAPGRNCASAAWPSMRTTRSPPCWPSGTA